MVVTSSLPPADNSSKDPAKRRFPKSVYKLGTEPDPRFSLANERTFLAWLRTSLAFIAAGVALEAVGFPESDGFRSAGALVFIGLRELGTPHWLDTCVAMLTVLLIRLAAIRWHVSLPRFHLLDRD